MEDTPSQHLGNPGSYDETLAQVADVVKSFAPAHDLWAVVRATALVHRVFDGQLDGYQTLQTPYHNSRHTLEVFLCTARLLDGMSRAGRGLGSAAIDGALIGALLHDTGYVKTSAEHSGTGAQFTAAHVERSVSFAATHCAFIDEPRRRIITSAIRATSHGSDPNQLPFESEQERVAALVVATADVVGQMASREYLERLLFLYYEFKEASIGDFADPHALLENTAGFYRLTRQRLDQQLGGLADMLALHFSAGGETRHNYYLESIERNMSYLEQVLAADKKNCLCRLKRGGIVDTALKQFGA